MSDVIECDDIDHRRGLYSQTMRCPSGWHMYNDRCFQAFDQDGSVSWSDAEDRCENLGGYLAVVDSLDVNEFLVSIANLSTHYYWIGLHDIGTEGTFVWVDGTPYDPAQANWDGGQPDNYNDVEDCAIIWANGRWNDRGCDYTLTGYLCQHEADIPIKCDEDDRWSSVNDKCYIYVDQWITWDSAQTYCEAMGADLVIVDNQYVQDYLEAMSAKFQGITWLGASDTITNVVGSFAWIDGSALTYTNWKSGQPNAQYTTNCAQIYHANDGQWNVQDCTLNRNFVCQKPEGTCAAGWQIFKGSCYQFNTFFPSTWTDAKHTCDAQGGHLVTINNQAENDYLVSQFENLRSAGIVDIWIGVSGNYNAFASASNSTVIIHTSDTENDGNFLWSDGSDGTLTYANWGRGEPRNAPDQDDCGSIYVDNDDGYWDILNCYIPQAFVCEIREGQAVVPLDPNTERGSCPTGWSLHGDYCYLFETIKTMPYAGAENKCESYGGTLASIEDGDEQSFLSGRMDNIRTFMWIGLHDRGTEDGWEWVDGTPYSFQNWASGEPNNYDNDGDGDGEDCVRLEYEQSKRGEWNDKGCGYSHGFICKRPKTNDGGIVTEAPKVTPKVDPKCGSGYEIDSSTNTCYKFEIDDYVDWSTAESTCKKSGGHLLSIKDQTEQTFVNARMYGLTSAVFWIGANDRTYEGGWEWSDGTPFAYLNWNDGEPNNYDHGYTTEDCTEIIVSSGKWNDHKCDQNIGYICKNKGDIVEYYNVYRNYVLDGYDTLHIDNVLPEVCAQRCLLEKGFTCYSFDYDRINMACDLSTYTKETSGIGLETDSNFDHYQVVSFPPVEVTTTLAPNSRCEYGWSSYGSYCYFAQTVKMPWLDARDSCRREGADLISIRDSNEDQFMISLMQNMCDAFHSDSTDDQYIYRYVSAPIQNSRVTFEVKASSDVHISLSANNYDTDPMYEIVIGGWGNTQSVIRRCIQCANEVVASTIDIVSPTEFRAFWITFVNGKISVGKDGETAFMEWTDPDPLSINYVGYTTGFGSNGEFILCTDHSDSDFVWIGINDLRTEMTYEWSDLTEVTYTRWNNGEPNNSGEEDCVHSYVSGSLAGYWNDDKCSDPFMSVCKKAKQVLSPTTQSVGDCGTGWYSQSYSCYRFVSDSASWSTAESQCKSYGGSLIAINDNIEQSFVSSKLAAFTGSSWYWIGLTDLSQAGQFTWSDGDPVTYTNWDAGQPDNSQGDCVGVSSGTDSGLWTAGQCDNSMPYICEKTRPGFTKPPVTAAYPTNPSDEGCADGWLGYGSKCFLAISKADSDNRLSWDDALLDCRNRGGDLASFHSDDELRYVKTNSKVINFIDEFWIGLNDKDDENGFVWSDGSPVNFVTWDDGEPNDYNDEEDCVEMTFAAPKGWNDRKCTRKKNWVCQIPKGVMPASTIEAATATISSNCGNDLSWVYSIGACYYFSSGREVEARKGWDDARDFCLSHAGDLASIHSGLEQEFIFSHLRDIRTYTAWIGLRESTAYGTHLWSDGTPVDYVYWDEDQPDDAYGAEQCVELLGTDGEWNDQNCGERYWFVCKKLTSDTAPKTREPTVLPSGYCPPGFMEYKNKCYSFNGAAAEDTLRWNDARIQCGKLATGGDLVSIHSQEIQSFLSSRLRDINHAMWIGLSDIYVPGQFGWQDGSAVDYTNWAANEPNGLLQENCVEFHHRGYDGKWNDNDCERTFGYACQALKDPSYPPPTQAVNPCRTGYEHYWNGCYKQLTGSYTWDSAKEACVGDGSDLVSIEDIYEQYYIETHMFQLGSQIWIGLNDLEQKGTYGWSDGSPVFYTKWAIGEPSYNTGEGCVQMTRTGGWDDTKCNTMIPAVCKYYIGNKPTTPSPGEGSCNFGNTSDWTEYNRACYNMDGIKDSKSWAEASYECDKKGGYLVTIGDEDENNYIEKVIAGAYANIWLGLTRNDEGGFRWVDDMALDYTRWAPGEPNNANDGEDCGEMFFSSSEWNDNDCFISAGYICKRQKGTAPVTLPGEGQPEKQTSGMSGGTIFGIILGVVAAVAVVLVLIYILFIKRDSLSSSLKKSSDLEVPYPVGFDNTLYATSTSASVNTESENKEKSNC
ncbi:macrophage mannose receptor 1-like [Glandiceps talaboti]